MQESHIAWIHIISNIDRRLIHNHCRWPSNQSRYYMKSFEIKPLTLLLLLLACLLSGANAQNYNLMSSETSDVPLTDYVQYSCLFKNLWTSTRHPVAYPSFARWSPIVLVAHSEEYTLWEEGQLASPGVENVAEVSKCYQSTICQRSLISKPQMLTNALLVLLDGFNPCDTLWN